MDLVEKSSIAQPTQVNLKEEKVNLPFVQSFIELYGQSRWNELSVDFEKKLLTRPKRRIWTIKELIIEDKKYRQRKKYYKRQLLGTGLLPQVEVKNLRKVDYWPNQIVDWSRIRV